MRKINLIAMICLTSMLVVSIAQAFQNEPDGFRGLKWGTVIDKPEQLKGLINELCDDNFTGNLDKNHKLKYYTFMCYKNGNIGGIAISGLFYYLDPNHKFYQVSFSVNKSYAFQFIDVLKAKYGEPSSQKTNSPQDIRTYIWESNKSMIEYVIRIEPTEDNHLVRSTYAYCSISSEKIVDEINTDGF